MSPAQLLFGRALADFLPVNPKEYQLHPYWTEELNKRQTQRSVMQTRQSERYNIGTRKLKPLTAGQHVLVQHHTTKRWDRHGIILESLPHRKYKIRMSDTGNITSRNRRFVKPSTQRPPVTHLGGPTPSNYSASTHPNSEDGTAAEEEAPEEDAPTEPQVQLQGHRTADIELPQNTTHRLPLALRQLLPHNNQGLKESGMINSRLRTTRSQPATQ
jgi:hypothetical protein